MVGISSVIQPNEKLEPEKYYQGNPIAKKIKKVKVDLTRNKKYIDINIKNAEKLNRNLSKLKEGEKTF
jgi:hypothetical protein